MSQTRAKTDAPPGLAHGEPVWEMAESSPHRERWSEAQYLSFQTNRRVEFSHGDIEFLPMPTTTHQRIVGLLYRALYAFVGARLLGEVLPSGIRVQVVDGKFREPDIVFMLAEHTSRIGETFWLGADLVMEVVSDCDEDRSRDLLRKRQEYAEAGIPEYWIVDRQNKQITVLVLDESTYMVHGGFSKGDQAVSRLLSGFSVDVTAVLEARG